MGKKIIHEYGHVYIKFFISLSQTMVQATLKKKTNEITNKANTICHFKMPFQIL